MSPVYQLTPGRRAFNLVIGAGARLGLVPGISLLTVRGRRSGLDQTVPVTIIEEGDQRWLVAPYGAVSWVHNARAAGQVSLRRGRRRERLAVEEVGAAEAAPILRTYANQVPIVRPYFTAGPGDPVEAFEAEAGRHPVFRLKKVNEASGIAPAALVQ
jgi:deazaflavin-dependent oxidoreductase (nitroreductase family)